MLFIILFDLFNYTMLIYCNIHKGMHIKVIFCPSDL